MAYGTTKSARGGGQGGKPGVVCRPHQPFTSKRLVSMHSSGSSNKSDGPLLQI